jgi:hypothetical protein
MMQGRNNDLARLCGHEYGRVLRATEASCEVRNLSFRARVFGPTDVVQRLSDLVPTLPAWTARATLGTTRATTLRVRPGGPGPDWYQVCRDETPVFESNRAGDLLPYLLWAVNTAAIEALSHQFLLFHAGAVAEDGRGLLLAAPSGSGKSTLVAGLLGAGLQYLSDDVVPVDPQSLRLLPFAKCVGLKYGARLPLSHIFPHLLTHDQPVRSSGESVWYLRPDDRAWPTAAIPLHHIVLPRYVAGARTGLTPISRSGVLSTLLEQSFDLRPRGAAGIERTVRLVQSATCHTLTVGHLDEAVDVIRRLLSS